MTPRPWVLGISCSHNGSACLLHGDEIVAAVQDERILRYKRRATNARFVKYCVRYCLETGGIRPEDLQLIVYSITRGNGPEAYDDIFLNEYLRAAYSNVRVITIGHHHAHAMSAFATSGFRRSAILVVDGSGTMVGRLSASERATVVTPDADSCDWEWLSYYEAEGTTLKPV
jgi:carbamoyltransferase